MLEAADPDTRAHTADQTDSIRCIRVLVLITEYAFSGYVHLTGIPPLTDGLLARTGLLVHFLS